MAKANRLLFLLKIGWKLVALASSMQFGRQVNRSVAGEFCALEEDVLPSLSLASSSIQGTIANSLTCVQLHKRAEKIAVLLMERGHLQDGDHVALVYPPGKTRRCVSVVSQKISGGGGGCKLSNRIGMWPTEQGLSSEHDVPCAA